MGIYENMCNNNDIFDNLQFCETSVNIFDFPNEMGEMTEYTILRCFKNTDTGKKYIIYTDGVKDEEGNTRHFAAEYEEDDHILQFSTIQTDDEWRMLEFIWKQLKKY